MIYIENMKDYSSSVSWKELNFTKILASIQMNKNSTILSKENLKNAPPLKIYRKEIGKPNDNTTSRIGITIKSFEIPNGYLITDKCPENNATTYLNKKDAGVTNNKTDNTSLCSSLSSNGICLTTQKNALNRIRTSGIIKKEYSTDTRQYLEKRCKTFHQSQYNYLVKGDDTSKPGSATSSNNTYSSGCMNVVYKPNNSEFACQGAVSSSSLILRKKYVAVTGNANKYLIPYGSAVSDAMTYGVSDSIYTYKNKFAFPTKMTPLSRKNTDVIQFCANFRSKR
jgi:hypothetical protein